MPARGNSGKGWIPCKRNFIFALYMGRQQLIQIASHQYKDIAYRGNGPGLSDSPSSRLPFRSLSRANQVFCGGGLPISSAYSFPRIFRGFFLETSYILYMQPGRGHVLADGSPARMAVRVASASALRPLQPCKTDDALTSYTSHASYTPPLLPPHRQIHLDIQP